MHLQNHINALHFLLEEAWLLRQEEVMGLGNPKKSTEVEKKGSDLIRAQGLDPKTGLKHSRAMSKQERAANRIGMSAKALKKEGERRLIKSGNEEVIKDARERARSVENARKEAVDNPTKAELEGAKKIHAHLDTHGITHQTAAEKKSHPVSRMAIGLHRLREKMDTTRTHPAGDKAVHTAYQDKPTKFARSSDAGEQAAHKAHHEYLHDKFEKSIEKMRKISSAHKSMDAAHEREMEKRDKPSPKSYGHPHSIARHAMDSITLGHLHKHEALVKHMERAGMKHPAIHALGDLHKAREGIRSGDRSAFHAHIAPHEEHAKRFKAEQSSTPEATKRAFKRGEKEAPSKRSPDVIRKTELAVQQHATSSAVRGSVKDLSPEEKQARKEKEAKASALKVRNKKRNAEADSADAEIKAASERRAKAGKRTGLKLGAATTTLSKIDKPVGGVSTDTTARVHAPAKTKPMEKSTPPFGPSEKGRGLGKKERQSQLKKVELSRKPFSPEGLKARKSGQMRPISGTPRSQRNRSIVRGLKRVMQAKKAKAKV